ncbi:MAG: helix-turn-helix domain-containing protein [Propionibacteriaceae bacterium]|nr:helix-turn-helix domain-containing protein [Propionibacteriaceae bacterium]
MTPVLVRDAEALRDALASGGEEVNVSLSRETAQLVATWIDAQARGQDVVVTLGLNEVSPGDAALMLGMSRAQVRKLMDEGALPFRMVGSHHRIRIGAIRRWLDIEDARQEAAMAELAALQNELGLTD